MNVLKTAVLSATLLTSAVSAAGFPKPERAAAKPAAKPPFKVQVRAPSVPPTTPPNIAPSRAEQMQATLEARAKTVRTEAEAAADLMEWLDDVVRNAKSTASAE
jgi:cytochrome P450